MGLNDRISSVRTVDPQANVHDSRYSPAPVATYNYHQRSDERLYDANVTSVRGVVEAAEQLLGRARTGPATRQCQRSRRRRGCGPRRNPRSPGRQRQGQRRSHGGRCGGRRRRANFRTAIYRLRRRIERATASTVPLHSEPNVGYTFRGQEHHAQMTSPPGQTVRVNSQGEPRT
jgi:hypothetical protein